MAFALYCKDIKEMIDLNKYNAEVFKSGKYVMLHFKEDNEKVENKCLDLLRKKGLNCCPERIPTNGYYKLSRKKPVWAGFC